MMSAEAGSTRVVTEGTGLRDWLAANLEGRAVEMIVDRSLMDLRGPGFLTSLIPHSNVRTHAAEDDGGLEEIEHLVAAFQPDAVVIGVGGGAVIDRAKLVALLGSNPKLVSSLSPRHRSGFILLPSTVKRKAGLVIVPTTVGTGAEQSRTACLQVSQTKKLIYSAALRPDLAFVTADSTESLPIDLLVEGIVEILMRVGSFYVGHHGEREDSDRLAEDLAADVVRLGEIVADCRRLGRQPAADIRESVALLSGATHRPEFHEGLAPFSDRCWPLANELSTFLSIRKVTAMAAIGPELWRRIGEGAHCWGSDDRLRRWWSVIAAAGGRQEDEPSVGLRALLRSWGLAPITGTGGLGELTRRTEEAWGRGLPMLRGVTSAEIRCVYSRVFAEYGLYDHYVN